MHFQLFLRGVGFALSPGMKSARMTHLAKYLARTCPKCSGYFGVIVSKLPHRSSIHAVSGWCKHCNYEIAWALLVTAKLHPSIKPFRNPNRTHCDT
jgi:hypothetical protein